MINKNVLFWFLVSFFFIGCESNMLENDSKLSFSNSATTRSIPVPIFNWETADWMPTPLGQSQIPPPWIGQGSLAYAYSSEIIEDYKSIDGWVLVYNTFDANAPGPLSDPYFILYNRYRGLLRLYLYINTPFSSPSTYMIDAIGIRNGDYQTSMLNFLGKDFIDASVTTPHYTQVQPKPGNSPPFATNRWYMMQYEIAYDPSISVVPYTNLQLGINIFSVDVTEISLGGDAKGEIKGTVGQSAAPLNSIFDQLSSLATKTGAGALAIISKSVLDNNTINSTTGENKLGLKNSIFKDLATDVGSAISSFTSGLPVAAANLLSAIIGGSSVSGPTPINLNLNVNISMKGTAMNQTALPGTPVEFYVPGTDIDIINAPHYFPAYNEPLGVIHFAGKPTLTIDYTCTQIYDQYGGDEYYFYFPSSLDFFSSGDLLINPAITDATINVLKQDLIFIGKNGMEINPATQYIIDRQSKFSPEDVLKIDKLGVRFTIKVTPHGGGATSIIIKTFELTPAWNQIN